MTVRGIGSLAVWKCYSDNREWRRSGRGNSELRPLYASRRGVSGAALRPWVWVLPGFTTNGSTSGIVNRERPHGRPRVERDGRGIAEVGAMDFGHGTATTTPCGLAPNPSAVMAAGSSPLVPGAEKALG
uniref:Uncharacterized protein n=1 Tax=Oryza rufipogon TaxID=4529 RepID=A0A0E0N7I5_ORYRU